MGFGDGELGRFFLGLGWGFVEREGGVCVFYIIIAGFFFFE